MPRKAQPGREVKGGMGQALLNKRKNAHWKKQANTLYAGVHVSDSAVDGGSGKLASVTDRHELDDFFCDALLKEQEFEVQHQSTVILTSDVVVKVKSDRNLFEYETIPIPRRPHWDETTTHEQLDRAERESFMKWRRMLADMEESLDGERELTPFEKNLEVWKQLWRVLERSQIAVQILDARNPLLFRSKDMEKYVAELGDDKMCLLVINKADYLTPHARRVWADYFTKNNIDFVFWSAALEQNRLDELARKIRRTEQKHNYHGHNHDDDDEDPIAAATRRRLEAEQESSEDEQDRGYDVLENEDDEEDEDDENKVKKLKASSLWNTTEEDSSADAEAEKLEQLKVDDKNAASSSSATPAASSSSASAAASSSSTAPATAAPAPGKSSLASHRILTRDELFSYIINKFVNSSPENKAKYEAGERITLGFAGYPNVGKSSTINVLAGSKKVVVGATPGKTKHFQTINVTDQITLCDCPGLVFPTFLSSRAELVCNGIMPIDQIKDWKNIWAPVQLVTEKVSRSQIQQAYSLVFPHYKELGADELLNSYARMRSFYKDHGRPDEAHAARILLKDFCAGKLLYCHPPPDLSFEQRRGFYKSFHANGKCMIHESLVLSPEEVEQKRLAQIAKSVEGLAGSSAANELAEKPSAPNTSVDQENEEAGIVSTRRAVATKKRGTDSAAASSSSSSVKLGTPTNASLLAELEDDDDDESEGSGSEEDEEDQVAASRPARKTVNKLAHDALLRDDMENIVAPSTMASKEAAKLLEQGLNPDGTPLTKKQIQRMNQRVKKHTGKQFKARKNNVPMSEVGFKVGGKSSDSAARLGVFHG